MTDIYYNVNAMQIIIIPYCLRNKYRKEILHMLPTDILIFSKYFQSTVNLKRGYPSSQYSFELNSKSFLPSGLYTKDVWAAALWMSRLATNQYKPAPFKYLSSRSRWWRSGTDSCALPE